MADIWLRSSDGNDGNAGTAKEAPKLTLNAAMAAAGAGGHVYVSDLHSQVQASAMTLSSPGTYSSPLKVLCVPDWGGATGSTPPSALSTGASVGTSGNNNLTLSGLVADNRTIFDGMTLFAGSGASGNAQFVSTVVSRLTFRNCSLQNLSTGTTTSFNLGVNGSAGQRYLFHLINTNFRFGTTGANFICRGGLLWENTPNGIHPSGSVPTNLFGSLDNPFNVPIQINGVDLSAMGSGTYLYNAGGSGQNNIVRLRRCKLDSSVGYVNGSLSGAGGSLVVEACGGSVSVSPMELNYWYDYWGTAEMTLTRYRSGGADDGFQTNPFSLALVSSAACDRYVPFKIPLTAGIIAADVSPSGATGLGFVKSSECAEFGTPAALDTDSGSTWNGTGVGTKQQISITLDNGETWTWHVAGGASLDNDELWIETLEPDQVGGVVNAVVCLAKPSTTVYIDPVPTIT